ncbi:MAG TPA: VIT domain-containing protein [Polyangiaceae bacterium]|nr:VIT domain-containing protein [Polyangiaceae bacterium]
MVGRLARSCAWLLFGSLFFWGAAARADEPPRPDATLAPFFVIEHGDPALDHLPLESTKVDVAIADVVAEVTVTQVYENRGTRPINTRYVFPASTRAAVHALTLAIRDQVIEAKIKEREQAKRTFEQGKAAGKTATLLEEQRPNVFSMSLANVLPGDHIEVTLKYDELLVPTEGNYEFVFPTVVGPRYSNLAASEAPSTSQFVAAPYLKQGAPVPSRFELSGTLASAIPLAELGSATHALTSHADNPNLTHFALDPSDARGGNRDFVLRYRLAGGAIQSGLSLFEGGGEKFFLLEVEPPARVTDADAPPRDFVFIVDVSGSMIGYPLDTAKGLLERLVSSLRPTDTFNVLLFSGGSRRFAPHSLPATPANVTRALAMMKEQTGGGATELLPAMQDALSLESSAGRARSFVLVTDGYVEADKRALDFVSAHLGDANVFAFGIGSSVNRYLIEGIAKAGFGEPFVATTPADAEAAALRFEDYVRAPVLTDVRVAYDGLDVYDVEPRTIPDVLAARPVVVFGKYRGEARGTVTLTGVGGRAPYTQGFDVARSVPSDSERALPYLWARARIASLSDFGFGELDPARKTEVTALGLRYSLLTPFTSFVAVSHLVRNAGAPARDVDQPLPLPAGVSNSAVGEPVQSADEPELWLVGALGALFLALARHRARREEALP